MKHRTPKSEHVPIDELEEIGQDARPLAVTASQREEPQRMTTLGTTLIEEMEHACNSASVLAMYASRDGDENRAQIYRAEATRLHQRYTRVRDFPRVLSGELQIPGVTTTAEMFEWLTGPIPEAVAIEQVRPPEAAPIETRDEGSCTICGEKGEG